MLMVFVRKFFLVLATTVLPIFLFTAAVDFGIVRILGNPAPVKETLADSGIYSSAVNSALDQAKQVSGVSGQVPLSDPAIRSAAAQAFNPQFIQQSTETVIDSFYQWLDGQTPLPDFRIDLTNVKTQFAANVAEAARQRAATLLVCTTANPSTNFEAFSASCLPKGLTPAAVATNVQNTITNGQGFLDHPIVTADSIKSNGSNVSVFADQLKNLPSQYQKAKKTPLILAVLTLIMLVGVVFLSSSWKRGLHRAGMTLAIIGVFILVLAWAVNRVVTTKITPQLKLNNAVLQDKVRTLINDVMNQVDKTYMIVGGGYAVLGALAIGGAMLVGRGGGKPALIHEKTVASPAPEHETAPISSVADSLPKVEPAKEPGSVPETPKRKKTEVK